MTKDNKHSSKITFTPAFPSMADSEMVRSQPTSEVLFTGFSSTHTFVLVPSVTDIALVLNAMVAAARI